MGDTKGTAAYHMECTIRAFVFAQEKPRDSVVLRNLVLLPEGPAVNVYPDEWSHWA